MSCPLGKAHVCCTQISNLTVQSGKAVILDNISLHMHCGELTAIVGRNGAGKTTFLKALLGAVPHTGTITFESENKAPTTKPRFGYVPQQLSLDAGSPVSVEDLVLASVSRYPVWLPRRKKDKTLVQHVLSRVSAESLAEKKAGELSGGEMQRVMLALAIHPVPDILLLDEPVSAVDKTGIKLFYDVVSSLRYNYDITILLISHDLDIIARHADRVVLIDREITAQGTVEEVYNSTPFIETFGHIIAAPPTRFNNFRKTDAEHI
ncbi:MAG: metal ABC transporter ATP-binding protein [Treponema sp.]|nr:metal ABC transporter ATP-binding protein [Treponema sp.]